MAIYNISGDGITSTYGVNGTSLSSAYNISGDVVYTQETDSIELEDVASYYQTPVSNAVTAVNALSDDCIAFIIVTDTHTSSNSLNSQNIVRYMLKNSKADKCFLLGDYSGNLWDATEYTTYASPLASNCPNKVFATLGNHEWFGNPSWSNLTPVYEDFLEGKSGLHGDATHFYYYFDDATHKLRYVVLNTAESSAVGFTTAQETWLKTDALQLPDSDWQVAIFGHHSLTGDDGVYADYVTPKTSTILNAFSYCNGSIIGYFHGHEHNDWVYTAGNGAVRCISLACDTRGNSGYYADKGCPYAENRNAGTTNEQVVTIVMINTSTGSVTFRRIGAIYMQEADMAFNYMS